MILRCLVKIHLRGLFRIALGVLACFGQGFTHGHASSKMQATHPMEIAYSVQSWHEENGLPSGTVSTIQQTFDGLLWFGTPRGLVRFDGTRFEVFTPSNTPQLKSQEIVNLFVARDGDLWIFDAARGVTILNRENFSAAASLPPYQREDLVPEPSLSILEDAEDCIWVHKSRDHVFRFKRGSWTTILAAEALPLGNSSKLISDDRGSIFLLSGEAAYPIAATGIGDRVPINGQPDGRAQFDHFLTTKRSNHTSLVAYPLDPLGYSLGFACFDGAKWQTNIAAPLTLDKATDVKPISLQISCSGQIWCGFKPGGLYLTDTNGRWRRLASEEGAPQGYILCLFEDRLGQIWGGSLGGGLFRIHPKCVSQLPLNSNLTRNAIIATVCQTRTGTFWVGLDAGGLLESTPTQTVLHLPGQIVHAVLEDQQTNLWVGTSEGLYRHENENFVRINPFKEFDGSVLTLFQDRKGQLWAATHHELIWGVNGVFTNLFRIPDSPYLDIRSLTEDTQGDVWIGTMASGLYQFPRGRLDGWKRRGDLAPNNVRTLHTNTNGLWIGIWGYGLALIRNGNRTLFSLDDGLMCDRIQSIQEDDHGNLWLSADNGIFGIPIQSLLAYKPHQSPPLSPIRLTREDGLQNRPCSGGGQPTSFKLADGRILIPTMTSVAVLDPRLAPKPPEELATLRSLIANGDTLPIPPDKSIIVSSSIRRYEFHYGLLILSSVTAPPIRYKLENQDQDWVNGQNGGPALYGQLPPGTYRFRIQSGTLDGKWVEHPTSTILKITPQWWQQARIQIPSALVLCAVFVLSIRHISRRKLLVRLEQARQKQAISDERRRIAQDLHDDVGARLTEISTLTELVKRSQNSKTTFQPQLNLISTRTRELITAVEEVVWTTTPQNDTLPQLANYLCEYTQRMVSPSNVHCRLNIPTDLPDATLDARTRHHLLLAVKEAVNNSIKHAHPKEIRLNIHVDKDRLIIEICDDGCGFTLDTARPHQHGLGNLRNRLQACNGTAEIKSQPGRGTAVQLVIPLQIP